MDETVRKIFLGFSSSRLLAATALAEGRNQGRLGMQAIMCVIRNRVVIGGRYGEGYHGVILKPWQFSCFNDQNHKNFEVLLRTPDCDIWRIADSILSFEIGDITEGATHYCNPNAMQKATLKKWLAWCGEKKFIGKGRFGDHIFFKEVV